MEPQLSRDGRARFLLARKAREQAQLDRRKEGLGGEEATAHLHDSAWIDVLLGIHVNFSRVAKRRDPTVEFTLQIAGNRACSKIANDLLNDR